MTITRTEHDWYIAGPVAQATNSSILEVMSSLAGRSFLLSLSACLAGRGGFAAAAAAAATCPSSCTSGLAALHATTHLSVHAVRLTNKAYVNT